MRIKIEQVPSKKSGGASGLNPKAFPLYHPQGEWTQDPTMVNSTLGPVDPQDATLEAELGESALIPDLQGLPAHFKIGGNRHSQGGTPLALPPDSFVFSDTRDMKLGGEILKTFGKGETKKKYTPADLAKQYDINRFRRQLQDPMSDPIQVSTAELMIENYNKKLAQLGLVQESIKGFPDGIPTIALPYLSTAGIDPGSILPLTSQEGNQGQSQMQFGGSFQNGPDGWGYQKGGSIDDLIKQAQREKFVRDSTFQANQKKYALDQQAQRDAYAAKQAEQALHVENYDAGIAVQKAKEIYEKSLRGVRGFDPDQALLTLQKAQSRLNTAQQKYQAYKNPVPTNISASPTTVPDTTWKMPTVTLPDQTQLKPDTLGNAAFEQLMKKKMGGDLPQAKDGKTIKRSGTNKSGNTVVQYTDGTVEEIPVAKNTPKQTFTGISAWPGDKTDKSNKSKYSSTQWKEFAKAFCPECKTNQEIQAKILSEPNFKDDIDSLHKKYGMPSGGKEIDGKLGHRWDFAMETTPAANPTIAKGIEKAGRDINPGQPKYNQASQYAPWWLQDTIQTLGAAGDFMRIKKYLPWAPKVSPTVPDATFYDPTRELASNAEQMSIGTQGVGVFSGPQAYNSRFSQIQGQGAKNAADILGKYNNMNISEANQHSAQVAGIYNNANEFNAKVSQDLYDKTTVANQQFDNAKNQARQELRSSYIQALTNRGQTQALNTLYPNYHVDPSHGGLVDFYHGDQLLPGQTQDQVGDFVNRHKYMSPEEERAWNIASRLYGPHADLYESQAEAYRKKAEQYPRR